MSNLQLAMELWLCTKRTRRALRVRDWRLFEYSPFFRAPPYLCMFIGEKKRPTWFADSARICRLLFGIMGCQQRTSRNTSTTASPFLRDAPIHSYTLRPMQASLPSIRHRKIQKTSNGNPILRRCLKTNICNLADHQPSQYNHADTEHCCRFFIQIKKEHSFLLAPRNSTNGECF